MRELEKEKSGSFWNQMEVKKKKKGEDVLMMGICVWWTKCKRKKKEKKKGNVWMKEKAKNKKSPFKNNTTIFSQ